uniref:Centrosomal protein 131 n=1 Tax=Canis lupus dingo TaxID=286419 RepID=A0A8C0K7U7_CANLU
MKGSRPASRPASTPEGSSEGVDLSLTGLPPPVSWRPNSASTTKPIARFSVVAGSEPRRKAPGPGGSRTVNNLRRSNSTTQVHQPPANQSPHVLTLSEGSPGGKKRAAGLSKTPSEKAATWNVLDDQPRAFASPPDSRSPSTVGAPVGPRRRECTVPLAPSFTANNRSNKGTVGNCVTTMVHNHYTPPERAPPPKSSNHTAPSLNNILKAATGAGGSGSFGKPHGDQAGSKHVAQNNTGGAPGPLRRKEVTEEEAERFIHQVNRAAVTIQRWYRHQVQRRQARAARLEHLPASNQEEQRRQLGGDSLLDQHQKKEAARRKAREEKARQARRAAIQVRQVTRGVGTPCQGSKHSLGLPSVAESKTVPPGDPCPPPSRMASVGLPPLCPLQDASAQGMPGEDLEVGGPAQSRAKSRVTLDELLDTLKLLEEEPEPLPRPRAYRKDKYSWTDEVTEDDASNLTADNLERFGKLSTCDGPSEDGTLLSEAKLQSIMSFLHEMEMEQLGQDRPASAPQGLALEDGRPEPGSTVSTSVMRLKLEVEEKKQAVGLLQRALMQQRDLTVRRVKETEKELGRQLRQQRDHYEATIQRHLSFIDQLIEDKKALAERCEAVVAELKQRDQRRKDREAQVQEQHELEIKKLKELMSATEKVRREKWINEKTRKIKEITVRGLEPEIQKLIARHKQEVKKLKSVHEAELLQADARAAQRCARQVEELREQLEREKEALGQQERERAQQRQRAELEELRRQLEESSAAEGRALRAEFEKGREEQERRHQMEMKALKDQLEAERQMWEANCAKKEEAWLLTRERELREEVRRGRDKEIELVIHRLEADMTRAREESERAAESRVQRLRDKYDAELSELEQSERKLQDRCTELKGRLGEAEGEGLRLQGLLRHKEKELARVTAVNEQLVGERSGLAEVLRREFADRLAASEEDTRVARAELAELRARQRLELEQLSREKVKLALTKKEEAVRSLRKQHEAAVKRADHLEELLEQRKWPLSSAK